jgi:hypothetical protein
VSRSRAITLLLLLLVAQAAWACPLCQGGGNTPDTVTAYKGITLFLALLPVGGGGLLFYWIYRKYRDAP